MKDYRTVYRFCVIRGTLITPVEDAGWSIHEEEEAFQSRERARASFLGQRDAIANEAAEAGGKARKAAGMYWYCLSPETVREFHYVRYDEVPVHNGPEKDDVPFLQAGPERICETGACWISDNVRHERREIRPDGPSDVGYLTEGSIKNPQSPMTFSKRHASCVYMTIRDCLNAAFSETYFDGIYPDDLREALVKRAAPMESPRKLFALAEKARKQGVQRFTVLVRSNWLDDEYNEWCHIRGWDPYNRDLPEYLQDYLNFRFLKATGRIEDYDVRSFPAYHKLCESCRMDAILWSDMVDPEAMLEAPFVTEVTVDGTWEDDFPLKVDVFFGFSPFGDDNTEEWQRSYDELSSAYDAYADYLRDRD